MLIILARKEYKMIPKRPFIYAFVTVIFLFVAKIPATAHFGMVIPSDDMVTKEDKNEITVKLMFAHPMEGDYLNLERPDQFGVFLKGKKLALLNNLVEKKIKGHSTWQTTYTIKRPGDHIFYLEPKPYWEPAEDCFIIHYTKVIVNSFGLEEGWDDEVGLKTEIVPLTRPYGLWTGNVFQGIVKVKKKPAPYTVVEVEYYNEGGKVKWPADPMITQVVKADGNGVFTYSMPKAGWWGFAALNEDDRKIEHNGEKKSVEIGAVLWVKTYDF